MSDQRAVTQTADLHRPDFDVSTQMHVVQLSTVHPRHDIRIRVKEVAVLADAFGSVTLVVQDGKGSQIEDDGRIVIKDVGAPGGRLRRAIRGSWRMWRIVRKLRPSIVHFHDPELIPLALGLRATGLKVVYDVHEDVPLQMASKYWIPPWIRRPVAVISAAAEWVAGHAMSGIVAATPTIASRFDSEKTITVQNFPILNEMNVSQSRPFDERSVRAIYVGVISALRGVQQMVDAVARVPSSYHLRLTLLGAFSPVSLEAQLAVQPGWNHIEAPGWVDRTTMSKLIADSRMGLVLFHPEPNHVNAQPNKLFEYMASGIPVIASDFPLWREIVNGSACGLLVDPLNPEAIAEAMSWLLDHPNEAEAMGRNGREAVESLYNWEQEAPKLVDFYHRLLSQS